MKIATVTVKAPDGGLMLINESDYDPAVHQLAGAVAPEQPEPEEEEQGEVEADRPAYAEWTKVELVQEAWNLGIEVVRADGDGEPLKSDYVRALEAAR